MFVRCLKEGNLYLFYQFNLILTIFSPVNIPSVDQYILFVLFCLSSLDFIESDVVDIADHNFRQLAEKIRDVLNRFMGILISWDIHNPNISIAAGDEVRNICYR